MVKVISFDLDNTIWFNDPVIEGARRLEGEFLRQNYPHLQDFFQKDPSLAKYREKVVENHPDRDHDFNFIRRKSFYYLAEQAGMPNEELEVFSQRIFEVFDAERQNVADHIYPGVLDTLKELKSKNIKLIALTNGTADISRIPVLNEVFDHHFSAFTAGALKPDPAPFQQMVEAAGVDKHKILHVGDNIIDDVQGAANFGIKTVWVHEKLDDVEIGHTKTLFIEESKSKEFHVGSIPSVAHLFKVLQHLKVE